MTDTITINKRDTIALSATIPRDLTDASVTFLFTDVETRFTAVIKDAPEGKIAVPLSQVDPAVGHHEIKWEIEYSDGTIEVLPPDGDLLEVKG